MPSGDREKQRETFQPLSALPLPSEFRSVAFRAGANLFLLIGCIFGLNIAGISWRGDFFYALVAIGLICFVEANLRTPPFIRLPPSPAAAPSTLSEAELQAQQLAEQIRQAQEDENASRYQRDAFRRSFVRSLVEIAILLIIATATIFLSRFIKGHPDPNSVSGQLLAETKGKLDTCHTDLTNALANLQACKAVPPAPKQIADFQRELYIYFTNHPIQNQSPGQQPINFQHELSTYFTNHPIADPPSPAFALTWPWLLVIIAAIVIFGLLAKKHKEAVPVATAAGLAEEALKHSADLVKMTGPMYWWMIKGFVCTSAILMGLFLLAAIIDICKRPKASPEDHSSASQSPPGFWRNILKGLASLFSGTDEKKEKSGGKETYLTSLGFSVLVLFWAALMVGYKSGEVEPPKQGVEGVTSEKRPGSVPVPLEPLTNFVKGYASLKGGKEPKDWEQAIGKHPAAPGDILLLIGSTDCKPFRSGGDGSGNPDLAKKRAENAGMWLQPTMKAKGITPIAISVEQHQGCRESPELRAVYPFLIQAKAP